MVVASNRPADYSATDARFKVNDAMQVEGERTFTYGLPRNDGLSIDLTTVGMHGSVSIEVYEDGKLIAQDSDERTGWAQVYY